MSCKSGEHNSQCGEKPKSTAECQEHTSQCGSAKPCCDKEPSVHSVHSVHSTKQEDCASKHSEAKSCCSEHKSCSKI